MVTLNDGNQIPAVGFGTYKSTNEAGYRVVLDAVRAGYRLLDTAKVYGNEEDVARAVRESGIPREDFFITSKLDRDRLGYDTAKSELEQTLRRLDTDYIDLYLLHWPRPNYGRADFEDWKRLDAESWKALEEMQAEGMIRSIGVSNFLPHHLQNLMARANVIPAVDQLELHPGYMQYAACDFCRKHGITLEAWSPIGRGRLAENAILNSLAEKYHTSVPHLCLVYLHQEGIVVLPKSSNYERMLENRILDDISLSEEDLWRVRSMPQAGWGGEHPDCERIYF
ncbi:MAG: aldo/keto reductase [Eubacteriales bacterium]|nr:aldo/keto reductase [Eubacteriales bacterium]